MLNSIPDLMAINAKEKINQRLLIKIARIFNSINYAQIFEKNLMLKAIPNEEVTTIFGNIPSILLN